MSSELEVAQKQVGAGTSSDRPSSPAAEIALATAFKLTEAAAVVKKVTDERDEARTALATFNRERYGFREAFKL